MRIFDTHCDTPFDMYRGRLSPDNNVTAVSLGKASGYQSKIFVTAFWSDKNKNAGECYSEFLESSAYFDGQIEKYGDKAMLCRTPEELRLCRDSGRFGAIKAIEGAKLLDGDLTRLSVLKSCGIRLMLPLWGGSDFIGGAWDTDDGLTDFGRAVIGECERLGIIVDTSHMSEKSFWDTAETARGAIIASHSDYKGICPHGRNLDDAQMAEIISRGGIIGLNLCMKHIHTKYLERNATPDDDFIGEAAAHIYYCLERGGEKSVCLGCDWDGTELPVHIPDVSYAERIYERLISDGISKSTADDIFFGNAYNFFKSNLKQ